MPGGQLNQIRRIHFVHPAGIKHDECFFRVQDLKNLSLIRLSIFNHLVPGEGLAGGIFSCRIADHAGEITDQKDGFVTEFLKLAQLVQ